MFKEIAALIHAALGKTQLPRSLSERKDRSGVKWFYREFASLWLTSKVSKTVEKQRLENRFPGNRRSKARHQGLAGKAHVSASD
jgi:hypothetical protein